MDMPAYPAAASVGNAIVLFSRTMGSIRSLFLPDAESRDPAFRHEPEQNKRDQIEGKRQERVHIKPIRPGIDA